MTCGFPSCGAMRSGWAWSSWRTRTTMMRGWLRSAGWKMSRSAEGAARLVSVSGSAVPPPAGPRHHPRLFPLEGPRSGKRRRLLRLFFFRGRYCRSAKLRFAHPSDRLQREQRTASRNVRLRRTPPIWRWAPPSYDAEGGTASGGSCCSRSAGCTFLATELAERRFAGAEERGDSGAGFLQPDLVRMRVFKKSKPLNSILL